MGLFDFGELAGGAIDLGGSWGDANAISSAVDEMVNMIGNEGQRSIMEDGLPDFIEWAQDFINDDTSRGEDFDDFKLMAAYEWFDGAMDKVEGTELIWMEGWKRIQEQAGWHDVLDAFEIAFDFLI